MPVYRRRPTRAEIAAVRARANAAIARADDAIQKPRVVRSEAYVALNAICSMFSAARPRLARMSENEQRAWDTRRRLVDAWLQHIAEFGI